MALSGPERSPGEKLHGLNMIALKKQAVLLSWPAGETGEEKLHTHEAFAVTHTTSLDMSAKIQTLIREDLAHHWEMPTTQAGSVALYEEAPLRIEKLLHTVLHARDSALHL